MPAVSLGTIEVRLTGNSDSFKIDFQSQNQIYIEADPEKVFELYHADGENALTYSVEYDLEIELVNQD